VEPLGTGRLSPAFGNSLDNFVAHDRSSCCLFQYLGVFCDVTDFRQLIYEGGAVAAFREQGSKPIGFGLRGELQGYFDGTLHGHKRPTPPQVLSNLRKITLNSLRRKWIKLDNIPNIANEIKQVKV
jgi:hypothetical protein